jgi:RimJ/RimL family protein N-acetyltransferase
LLEGKKVNLRVVEKEELNLFTDFLNDLKVGSEYMPILQQSKTKIEEKYDKLPPEERWFFIEKKDGSKIGWISHTMKGEQTTIEYALVSNERNKGYCTEGVEIMVDYLFLSKDIVHIQAETLVENSASQRVLEKAGFTKEGIKRKSSFVRGLWQDDILYSILREEWKRPKILTRTTS